MKLFAYKLEDGRLALASIFEDGKDPKKIIDPKGWYIDPSELPVDSQYWFNCLTSDADNRVYISIDKARAFTKERLRMERKPLLEALDVEFQRNLEIMMKPDQTIIAEKNRLRDITKLVNCCSTVEELKKLSCQKLSTTY
jgi:hypothetical protein